MEAELHRAEAWKPTQFGVPDDLLAGVAEPGRHFDLATRVVFTHLAQVSVNARYRTESARCPTSPCHINGRYNAS